MKTGKPGTSEKVREFQKCLENQEKSGNFKSVWKIRESHGIP